MHTFEGWHPDGPTPTPLVVGDGLLFLVVYSVMKRHYDVAPQKDIAARLLSPSDAAVLTGEAYARTPVLSSLVLVRALGERFRVRFVLVLHTPQTAAHLEEVGTELCLECRLAGCAAWHPLVLAFDLINPAH